MSASSPSVIRQRFSVALVSMAPVDQWRTSKACVKAISTEQRGHTWCHSLVGRWSAHAMHLVHTRSQRATEQPCSLSVAAAPGSDAAIKVLINAMYGPLIAPPGALRSSLIGRAMTVGHSQRAKTSFISVTAATARASIFGVRNSRRPPLTRVRNSRHLMMTCANLQYRLTAALPSFLTGIRCGVLTSPRLVRSRSRLPCRLRKMSRIACDRAALGVTSPRRNFRRMARPWPWWHTATST